MDGPFSPTLKDDWAQFFASEHQRPNHISLYPEVFENNAIFPLQRQPEMKWMIETAKLYNPRVVMDIGSDKGGGVYHWCKCCPTVEKVIACEIRGTPYGYEFEKAFPKIRFLWLPFSSKSYTNAMKPVARFLSESGGPQQIDCMFIDGDKSAFQEDFHNYLPYMNKQRGVVFMHDITDSVPSEAYGHVRQQFPKGARTYVNTSELQASLDRQAAGLVPANAYDGWLRHWRGQSCGVGYIPLGEDLLGKETRR